MSNSIPSGFQETVTAFFFVVVLFVIGVFTGLAGGYKDGVKDTRKEAVEAGHAVWVARSDGSTEFQWKGQE